MRFKDVFSIIGPAMIGPSSSHTAGAVRLGLAARRLLGGTPVEADVAFFGSFAETYAGHGTDRAIAAGLLGYATDDGRIRTALEAAHAAGMAIAFREGIGPYPHPNTVRLKLRSAERETTMTGCSIGGGAVEVVEVDGFDVRFSCHYPTLVLFHRDRIGFLAEATASLTRSGVNIGSMDVDRKERNGEALTALELDQSPPAALIGELRHLAGVRRICTIDLTRGGE